MKLTMYQVDAFADKVFAGNPAAVIPLDKWIGDELMQQIAMENNLAETVFFVAKDNDFDIRWFTPELEINLCGHATLASAYVLYEFLGYKKRTITFHSKSGPLYVSRDGETIKLDFPSWKPERIDEYPEELLTSLGNPDIVSVYKYRDFLVELNNEEAVRNCKPDFALMKRAGGMVIITAPGREVDFVSRFFAPTAGIDEDPVTGSAHSQLIPFWNYKLGKKVMTAKQLSKRGGDLYCEQNGDRVIMGGQCVFYMKGEINI
ncbi:MAG: PhzF family phenazine biosynthesis protein [Chitinophagales bacterium]|nr:PhzF family phenazine biosynthesis protein [Chitinophagales bacterium]